MHPLIAAFDSLPDSFAQASCTVPMQLSADFPAAFA
jgi:hypothetical protein